MNPITKPPAAPSPTASVKAPSTKMFATMAARTLPRVNFVIYNTIARDKSIP